MGRRARRSPSPSRSSISRRLGFGYVTFDDSLYISENPVVRAGLTGAGIHWAFGATHLGFWIPVTWLSLMLDVQAFGTSPGAEHLVNAGLHAINAALVFVALRRLTTDIWPSAIVAAIFAVHPLHVESVAWITERKDVLCALFWLLALVAYRPGTDRLRGRRLWTVTICMGVAVAAKPMAVTLPVTLLLLDHWPLGRVGSIPLGRLIAEKTPLFVIALAGSIVTAAAHRSEGVARSLAQAPLVPRLENAARVVRDVSRKGRLALETRRLLSVSRTGSRRRRSPSRRPFSRV